LSSPTRRTVLGSVGAIASAGLAGCSESVLDRSDRSAVERRTIGGIDDSESYVGMVYAAGGLGDRSFNDMANRGVKQARVDHGVEFANASPGSGTTDAPLGRRLETIQQRYARSERPDFDLVSCIGYTQAKPLGRVAKNHPDQQFAIVDSVVERDNVSSYVFEAHQGSFLVGHLAGGLTSREVEVGGGRTNSDAKVVGFLGGDEVPLIQAFEAGFVAGAKHADPRVTVLRRYAGTFGDPSKGKTLAGAMYDEGADVVYHAAGGTGRGVFQAAQANDRYAIGVDADQSRSLPQYANVILASMVKRVDTAVYRAIESVVDGSLEGGTVHSLGLERDGVGIAYGAELGDAIPTAVVSAVTSARESIVAGDVEVPTKPPATTKRRIGGTDRTGGGRR
jgi:basic membrane protein A